MIQVMAFDFDGTIADTIPVSIPILKKLVAKYSQKTVDNKMIQELRDKTVPEVFKELDISIIKLPFFARKARKELNKKITSLKPIKGVDNLLVSLKKMGIILCIVSSNSKESIKTFLANNNLEIFDFIYTNSRVFSKGNTLKKLVRKNKWSKENIIYIGDEVRDIEAARKAGIKIISVTWGVNSLEKLSAHNPDFLVKSPQELLTLFQSKLAPKK